MSTSQPSKQAQVQHIFHELAGRDPSVIVRAPGVVQLLGGELEPSEGWGLAGAIEPAESVSAMLKVIDGLTIKQNGQFLDYKDGRVIGW